MNPYKPPQDENKKRKIGFDKPPTFWQFIQPIFILLTVLWLSFIIAGFVKGTKVP